MFYRKPYQLVAVAEADFSNLPTQNLGMHQSLEACKGHLEELIEKLSDEEFRGYIALANTRS